MTKVISLTKANTNTKSKFSLLDWVNYLLNQEYCSDCQEYVKLGPKDHPCLAALPGSKPGLYIR